MLWKVFDPVDVFFLRQSEYPFQSILLIVHQMPYFFLSNSGFVTSPSALMRWR